LVDIKANNIRPSNKNSHLKVGKHLHFSAYSEAIITLHVLVKRITITTLLLYI